MGYIGREPTNSGEFLLLDDISGDFDGAEKSFTLSVGTSNVSPAAANTVIVLDGILQHPSSSYSISGSTISFTAAPDNGFSFYGVLAGQSQYITNHSITNDHISLTANISGSKINSNFGAQDLQINDVTASGNVDITGDLTAGGKITAQEFHTEFVSASIIFDSGSSKFGDDADDVHRFTGSVEISGSVKIGTSVGDTHQITGSIETSGSIILDTLGGNVSGSIVSTGSFGAANIAGMTVSNLVDVSSSVSTRLTTEEGNVDDLETDSGSFSTRVTDLNLSLSGSTTLISGSATSTGSFGSVVAGGTGVNSFTGKVGVGETSPDELVHATSTGNEARVVVESSKGKWAIGSEDGDIFGVLNYGTSTPFKIAGNAATNALVVSGSVVGIGTASPATQMSANTFLEIKKASGIAGLGLNGGGDSRWELTSDTGDDFKVSRNGSTKLTIDGSDGAVTFAGYLNDTKIYNHLKFVGSDGTTVHGGVRGSSNSVEIRTGASTTVACTFDGSQDATFAGNIITTAGSDANLILKSASTRSGIFLKKPGTDTVMGSVLMLADESFRLGTQNVYNMTMLQNGNVGIGRSPSYPLDVNQSTATWTTRLINTVSSGNAFGLQIQFQDVDPNNTTAKFCQFVGDSDGSSVERFEVRSNGGVINYQSSDGDFSDERLKKEIVDAPNFLEKINQIKVRNFKYKDQTDDRKLIGVIAQELEQVDSNLVTEENDIKRVYNKDIMFMMLKSIQELSTANDALEKRIEELEN